MANAVEAGSPLQISGGRLQSSDSGVLKLSEERQQVHCQPESPQLINVSDIFVCIIITFCCFLQVFPPHNLFYSSFQSVLPVPPGGSKRSPAAFL